MLALLTASSMDSERILPVSKVRLGRRAIYPDIDGYTGVEAFCDICPFILLELLYPDYVP